MSSGFVTQLTLRGVLRELRDRIRALEQSRPAGSGSDYVFLDEIIVENDGDPIEFASLSQEYRHVVVELIGATDDPIGNGNDSDDLLISWAHPTGTPDSGYQWGDVFAFNPVPEVAPPGGAGSPVYGESYTYEGPAIPVRLILPQFDISGGGTSSPFVNGMTKAAVTIKFPYYALDDLHKSCLYQAVSAVSKGGGNTNPSAVTTTAISGGGTEDDTIEGTTGEPIVAITLAPATYGWFAGSRAALYGIR